MREIGEYHRGGNGTAAGFCPPEEAAALPGPLLQRQVVLRDSRSGRPLVYAASWWNAAEASRHLRQKWVQICPHLNPRSSNHIPPAPFNPGAPQEQEHLELAGRGPPRALPGHPEGLEGSVTRCRPHAARYRLPGLLTLALPPAGLTDLFGSQGPYWARCYTFWNGGKPLTVIYEAFAPEIVGDGNRPLPGS